MLSPPRKRQASSSPSRNRHSKRPALTSSPEEGEVDDGASSALPTTATIQLPTSLPAKPVVTRVPFPFKKKNEPTVRNINVLASSTSSDSARKERDDDSRRNRPRRPVDHWEAGYDHGDRTRSWRSRDDRSPRRRSRSRSRDRHRLPQYHSPPRRTPEPIGFSPLSKPSEHDRPRDRSRSRDRGPERNRDSRGYRRYDDGGDRHYRPDDREWMWREDGDRHPRRPESYRPPTTPPIPTLQPLSPRLRPPSEAPPPAPLPDPAEPRPPTDTPPPAPPPDTRLMHHHPPLSFTVKKQLPPGLPAKPVFDTPPSTAPPPGQPAPPPPPSLLKRMETKPLQQPPKVRLVRRREFTKRLTKHDMLAYGRFLVGCGEQSDYEVTTKLGEGTFGEVHKAIQKTSGQVVALKRILMHHEKEGMPVTALREIKILKALKHPCIVNILDMFVVRSTEKDPLSVYMVFPYMDHDLAGLLENERVTLSPSQIKLYMKQLLEGTDYMHRNHILHRDMKAANLLISNTGTLQIADFGLARSFDVNISKGGSSKKYTNCVVTRWYRPPELLLGARQYGGEVDIWGIGCVLGEMFTRRPILPGTSDLDQLEKIWHLCGTPTQHTWPNFDALPGCEGVKRFNVIYPRRVKKSYESVGFETADLLDKLLVCNPKERLTAAQALEHEYFWTEPLPADPKSLPTYEASHEFDKRGHRNHHPMPHGGPLPLPPQQGKPTSDMHHNPRPRYSNNNFNHPNNVNIHGNNNPNRRGPAQQGSFNNGGGGNNHMNNHPGQGQGQGQGQPPSGPAAFRGGPPANAPLGPGQQQPFRPGAGSAPFPPGPHNGNMMPPQGPGGFHSGNAGRPPFGGGHGPYPPFPPHPNVNVHGSGVGMRAPPLAPGLPPRPNAPLGVGGGGGVNNFVRLADHGVGGRRGGGGGYGAPGIGDRGGDRGSDRGRGGGSGPYPDPGEGDTGGELNYG